MRQRTTFKWTNEADARVAEMLDDKWTANQIGQAMGLSRNAIIGRVHRSPELRAIGFWKKPGPQNIEKARPKPKARPVSPTVIAKLFAVVPVKPVYVAPVIAPVDLVDPGSIGITLTQFTSHTCKWPVNNAAKGEQHLFCGAESDGASYCPFHARKSIGRGTEGERTAESVLAKARAA